jgi:hypothetical protein
MFEEPAPPRPPGWRLALVGLALFVFAVVALSGPGRIDIEDGQTRFEVAQSLYEHGDSVVRDSRIVWCAYPGRGGERYSVYRLPHSLAGVPPIAIADATGPVSEGRRHFFFSLVGAAAAAALAVGYAAWFRRIGLRSASALVWAAGGVFTTPAWFYGTSTFDDVLGMAVVIAAVAVALATRNRAGILGAILTGLLLGLAYNCKQPLAAFGLIAVALHDDPRRPAGHRLMRVALMSAGVLAGIAADRAYEYQKFPPGEREVMEATYLNLAIAPWPGNLPAGVACQLLSPGAGVFWYCPPLLLGLIGVVRFGGTSPWARQVRWTVWISSGVFFLFISSLSFFKGDLCWGPRYLTPLFGVFWLFAPAGAARLRPLLAGAILVLGVVVQLLALSVDPHRLNMQRDMPNGATAYYPWALFHPDVSNLANRPREIIEIATYDGPPAEAFTPAPSPTFSFPITHIKFLPDMGPAAATKYHILNSFRPWWASMYYLEPAKRPVDLDATLALLSVLAAVGLALGAVSLSTCRRKQTRSEVVAHCDVPSQTIS